MRILFISPFFAAILFSATAQAQGIADAITPPAQLPAVNPAPLTSNMADDPIVKIARTKADEAAFHAVIAEAIKANPTVTEGVANRDASVASYRGAESALYPRIDFALSANRALAREYSNDPDNVIERARGSGRFDATATLEQSVFDFGANRRRIDAALARIEGSDAELVQRQEAIALRAISAWYDLFAYGHMVELSKSYIAQETRLRSAVNDRIAQGVAAPVERARLDSTLAAGRLRLAQFERELGNARARFKELFGLPAPDYVARAPAPLLGEVSDETLANMAANSPAVRAAEAAARGLRYDAKAARADTLPSVTAGVDAGRYGLLEKDRRDYDVRARLTLRYRLFGPGDARADEARSRAEASQARALGVRQEAEREVRIAWSDVRSLERTIGAYQDDYQASRITRDAVFERFRLARGSLYDTLDAEDRLFNAAASYIRALAELDTATFVALARANDLSNFLKIPPAVESKFP